MRCAYIRIVAQSRAEKKILAGLFDEAPVRVVCSTHKVCIVNLIYRAGK
ncbi:MAG: hypothetical protein HY472_01625 [Candidatus Sungbacteria bacterium]|nr:hypothetical protein [Candidatus Sungbacteria bacterium]